MRRFFWPQTAKNKHGEQPGLGFRLTQAIAICYGEFGRAFVYRPCVNHQREDLRSHPCLRGLFLAVREKAVLLSFSCELDYPGGIQVFAT